MDPILIEPASLTSSSDFGIMDVAKAKKVTLMFTRADDAGGAGVFSVTGTIDGSTYITLNSLVDNVTDSNAESKTRVASCTLSTETSKIYALDLRDFCLNNIKVAVARTTSGTHSVKALIEY